MQTLRGLERISNPHGLWLMPVILATQEAEIRRITVRSQLWQMVHETLSQKTFHKNKASGVAKGEGPEFKPNATKKPKTKLKTTRFERAQPIRKLQAQPTRMLLSAHLISIELEQHSGVNG
jgi:hypothetical protein